MRLTGPGIWGPPRDRDEAIREENMASATVRFTDAQFAAMSNAV